MTFRSCDDSRPVCQKSPFPHRLYTSKILSVILIIIDTSRQVPLIVYMPDASLPYDRMCSLTTVPVGGRFPSSHVPPSCSSLPTFWSYQIASRHILYRCDGLGMSLFVCCRGMYREAVCVGGILLVAVLSIKVTVSRIVDETCRIRLFNAPLSNHPFSDNFDFFYQLSTSIIELGWNVPSTFFVLWCSCPPCGSWR